MISGCSLFFGWDGYSDAFEGGDAISSGDGSSKADVTIDDTGAPTDTPTVDAGDTGSIPDTPIVIDSFVADVPTGVDTKIDCGALTLCGTTCVDVTKDARHCGDCATDCPSLHGPSSTCSSGSCTCPSDRCPATGAFQCTSFLDDSDNCNGCGNRCAIGKYCRGGACVCDPGLTSCSGTCIDIGGDGDHCGSCSIMCIASNDCRATEPLSGDSCVWYTYGCPSGRTVCPNGSNSSCFDLERDETHCGDCSVHCASSEVCVGGLCRRYVPAIGCNASPCDCSALRTPTTVDCSPLPGNTQRICVAGSACPS